MGTSAHHPRRAGCDPTNSFLPATSRLRHLEDNMGALHGRLPDEALRDRITAALSA